MKNANSLPTMTFETRHAWETWLEEHHADIPGIWLKIAKKGAGTPSVSYAEALESAICYGWIDGQKAAFDERFWLQKFTPRRPRSIWSRVNCDNATALIAARRMRPSGLAQVEAAKRGRSLGVGVRVAAHDRRSRRFSTRIGQEPGGERVLRHPG